MSLLFQPGDIAYLRSGGLPMTVVRVQDVGVKEDYVNVQLFWHDRRGGMQTIELPTHCLTTCCPEGLSPARAATDTRRG